MDLGIDVPPVIREGHKFLREDPPARIELWVGRSTAKLTKADAAREVSIDPTNPKVAPFIENGEVMLPVRFIAEALDLEMPYEREEQEIVPKLAFRPQPPPTK